MPEITHLVSWAFVAIGFIVMWLFGVGGYKMRTSLVCFALGAILMVIGIALH